VIKQEIEKKFNVTINLVKVDINNEEQWNLYWAGGDTADYIVCNIGTQRKLIDQGLVRPISEEMLRAEMPTWMAEIDSMLAADIVKAELNYDGKVYCIPYMDYAFMQTYIMQARKDWMNQVGITQAPKTLDQFHEMLQKFTFNDPDQNGQNDTYGIHATGSIQFNYVHGAYGVMPNSYYLINGKVEYSAIMPAYRDMLTTLAAWYQEGLIDPEFVTDTRDIQRKKWSEGKFGVLADHPWWFSSVTGEAGPNAMLRAKNPAALIEPFAAFTGPTGLSGGTLNLPDITFNGAFFGKDTTDAQVLRIMAIMEQCTADRTWYYRAYFGLEGQHYTLDPDGVIVPKAISELTAEQKNYGNGLTFALSPAAMDVAAKTNKKVDMPGYDISVGNKPIYKGVTFVFKGENKSAQSKGADIKTIADDFYFGAITGKYKIDTDWDAYVKRINDAGLQEILNEYATLIH
jgi:putative aldouronate transport system substrate-binding protein